MSASEVSASRNPSLPQISAENTILLVDHTVSRTPSYRDIDAENSDSDATPATTVPPNLSHRLTNNSFRQTVFQQYTKQKYARYGQDRYSVDDSALPPPDVDTATAPQLGQAATEVQKSYLERAQTRAKAFMKRKRALGKGDQQDTVIDVLFENQRGIFFFGIPKYSSASLLPSDPKPWQNGQFRTSAVDIRNAQVPDPSWEWAWKSWYVDMSRDVDEEGWEYSFAFVGKGAATFAWHGNHPWFHSFVRRRRWLRMRKRKVEKHHTREKAHELTSEYFTIHPKTVRPASLTDSRVGSSTLIRVNQLREPTLDIETMEISSIGDLFLALRKSSVDREKLFAVKKFIDEGGEEIIYLSERMGDIMGTFLFQSSRRQLLSDLMSRHQDAHELRDNLASHQHDDDDMKQQGHDRSVRRTENLLKAVHAADEQVKKLEYWSDIKKVGGVTVGAVKEEPHSEPSFKNKQDPNDRAHDPSEHAETAKPGTEEGSSTPDKPAPAASISSKSNVFFDSESQTSAAQHGAAAESSDADRYTTASETTTAERDKDKGKARALDGVAEEEEFQDFVGPQVRVHGRRRSILVVEPVPEFIDGE